KKEDFLELELFAKKRAENLYNAIQKSKKQPLERLVYGFGIPNVGEKAAFVLAQRFETLDALANASEEDLMRVPDIGPVVANSIRQFFKKSQVIETLKNLKKLGVNPRAEKIEAPTGSPLANKTVVFTGELETMSRHEA